MRKRNLLKIMLILASTSLIISFAVIVIEKKHLVNFYSKPQSSSETETNPVNTVDYSPAKDSEKPDDETKKQDQIATQNEYSQSTNNTNSVTISLSAAGQDEKGGPVIVRAIIGGANSGQCILNLEKGGISKSYTANIGWQGNYYSCNGFSVPFNDLSTGKWNATLVVNSDSKTGKAEQQITVEAK